MLPGIQVTPDLKRLQRGLNETAQQQIPFATARALTASADLARATITKQLPTIFDRPTPFTMRAVTIKAATKQNLMAYVLVKPDQAKYLTVQETGGETRPEGGKRAFVMATPNMPRNQYGNLPKGALRREKRKKDVFVGKVDGRGGFFQRLGEKGAALALAFFFRRFRYKPRFGFRLRVEKSVRATLPASWHDALRQAMATARRK